MSTTQMPTNHTPTGVVAALSGAPPTRTALAQFALLGRVAMVTGGQRGIGLELALALAEGGAVVYCLDLPPTPDADWMKVQQFCSSLPDLGVGAHKKGRMEYMSCNVTDQKAMWTIAEQIAEKEGRVDICIANAGVLRGAECLEWDGEDFKKLLDVNINGAFFTAQAAGRQMEKRNIRGSIVMIASMSGTITNPNMHWTAYNTSKAAVLQMMRSMACELGPKGIRVNALSPGYIYTNMTKAFLQGKSELERMWCAQNPLGRLGNPDELRGAALWLASDASTFCTGSDIRVDGGQTAW